MSEKSNKAYTTYYEWLMDQRLRSDAVGCYAKAVDHDCYSKNTCKLIETVRSYDIDPNIIIRFSNYCKTNHMEQKFGNYLMLGSMMSALEYSVGLFTANILTTKDMDNDDYIEEKKHIYECNDMIAKILQDIKSDLKKRN